MLNRIFSKFVLTGVVSTSFQFLVFSFLSWWNISTLISSGLGYISGSIVSYIMNYFFTFKTNSNHIKTIIFFYIMVSMGFLINIILMYVIAYIYNINAWLSQIVSTALVFLFNFIVSTNVVFKKKE